MVIPLAAIAVGIGLFLYESGSDADVRGIVIALISAASFSVYTIISKRILPKWGGMALTTLSFLIGCFLLGVFMLIRGTVFFAEVTGAILPQLVYLGIVVAGIGYYLYFLSIRLTSAITASTAFFMKIALGPLFSLILLHEKMSLAMVLGMLCVLSGAALMLYLRKGETAVVWKKDAAGRRVS